MSKISKKVVIVLALSLIFVMIFAGCSSTKQDPIAGGDASAVIENNGGLVVKQGNYIYYINGLTNVPSIKTEKDNEFGSVTKGAIMRATLDDKGNPTDAKVLVPLMALSANKKGGINVFGNWVYYTTPSVKKSSEGALQTSYLEFMRTSIDGTKTQNIATVDGTGLDYKYTDSALITFAGGTITRYNYDNDKVTDHEVVADKVSSILLPRASAYDPKGATDNVIFYTKAAEDEKAMYNETFVVGTAKGSEPTLVIGGKTYTDKDDKKLQYNVTLKNVRVNGSNIEVYYEKANANDAENMAGLYVAVYSEGKLNVASEVLLTDKSYANVFPCGTDGIFVFEGDKLFKMSSTKQENGVIKFNKLYGDNEKFPASSTIIDFVSYKFDKAEGAEAVPAVLYLNNNKLYLRALDDSLNYNAIAVSEEEYTADNTWLAPEVMNGKIYFFNTAFYGYLDVMTLDGDMAKGEDGKLTHPLAKLNAVDAKAEQDKKDKDKAEK